MPERDKRTDILSVSQHWHRTYRNQWSTSDAGRQGSRCAIRNSETQRPGNTTDQLRLSSSPLSDSTPLQHR